MAPPSRRSTPTPEASAGRSVTTPSATLQCCCGRSHCPALRRNTNIIESIEKDAHTAAQLGQALLARHEAYKADAERDRLHLTARIARLEMENRTLEAANAAKIEENRALLDQLETLNTTVSDADSKIRLLETNLLSSNQSVRRLESAAARAADAERHLSLLEQEQDRLHEELRSTREDARTHALRSKDAQRSLADMQDHLERLEADAAQERERHADIVKRIERQREVEKQLDAAAGRLKGAAATRSLQGDGKNNKIVGHFVRDLLQDNANLQLGIAELRELLENSNDEIQGLRDKLMYQEPAQDHFASPASTLKAELQGQMDDRPHHIGPALSQELHIHHHYHAAPTPKQGKKLRRTRTGLLPFGALTPTSASAPGTPPRAGSEWGGRLTASPTAPALLSHASHEDLTPTTSKPPPVWSSLANLQSDYSSSVPSSPVAHHRAVFDSDPPTSMASPVTSVDPMSPWAASHAKQPSIASSISFQSLGCLDTEPDLPPMPRDSIPEEDESRFDQSYHESTDANPSSDSVYPEDLDTRPSSVLSTRRVLRRTASHESIMSLSGGLDIHTLQARPSQMTLRPLGGADAVLTGVVAQPTLSRSSNKRSDAALRDNFAGFKSPRNVSSSSTASNPNKLRGWTAWRPWGGSGGASEVDIPTPSPSPSPAPTPTPVQKAPLEAPVTPQKKTNQIDVERRDMERSPGINQPGSIPGFQEYWASQKRKGAPAQVNAQVVDRAALDEVLLAE